MNPATWFQSAGCFLLAGFSLLVCNFCCFAGGVVNSADETSLRAALVGGGAVTFSVDGTIALSSPLVITNDTTIDGSGHNITISGGNSVRVFQVNSNVQFILETLTVANGRTNAGAGLVNSGGSVTISNCVFTNNQVIGTNGGFSLVARPGESVAGGALWNSGTLTLQDTLFTGNVAAGGKGSDYLSYSQDSPGGPGGTAVGGAIYNGGNLSFTGLTFTANGAYGGNGGAGPSLAPPGGGGSAYGGAIFSTNGSLSAYNCSFAANVATAGFAGQPAAGQQVNYRGEGRGGAIHNETSNVHLAALVIANSTASGAPASGGGLYHGGGVLTLSNAVLIRNSALADRITTRIASNGSTGTGGGLHNAATAILTDCLISSNTVTGGAGVSGFLGGSGNGGDANGGGIYSSETLGLWRCTLAGNSTTAGPSSPSGGSGGTARGGGVLNDGGSAWLLNCTLTGNTVAHAGGASYGGGLCNNAALTNCTLAGNSAIAGNGGNVAVIGSPASSINSIFSAGVPTNFYGGITDLGHNISSDSSASFGGPGSLNNTDPKLGPLGNYGGPTPTMPLLAGSPALDSADNSAAPPTDQRGRTRPYGPSADIGAFESSDPFVVVGRFFGLSVSDSIIATLDGTASTNIPSGGTYRFDGLSAGSHSITASSTQWVIFPNPLPLNLGPDVFDADFTAYPWNTVNLASPSNGAAHIVYAGTNGQIHRLLASSNLIDWLTIATNTVGPSNYYDVFDPGSAGQRARFYRSVSP